MNNRELYVDPNNFVGADGFDDGVLDAATIPTNDEVNKPEETIVEKQKTANQLKIEEIQARIDYLFEKSKNANVGLFVHLEGQRILADDYEECKALFNLIEILKDNTRESDIPFVFVNGLTIKENRLSEYYNALEKTVFSDKDYNSEEQDSKENDAVSDENINLNSDNPYEVLGVNEDANLDEIKKARNDLAKKYHPDWNPSVDEETIKKINDAYDKIKDIMEGKAPAMLPPKENNLELNAAPIEIEKDKENIDNSTITKDFIPGMNIPMPRKKKMDESYEEYEEYLKEHYKPYGMSTEEIEYYPGTEIPKPRGKYPHEMLDSISGTDSYYDEMLNYFANKYTPTENPKKEPEPNEVTGIRKATNFLKKHKKEIIVAIGITALTAACVPGVIPSVMYANSALFPHVPALVGQFLHGCNSLLSVFVGAQEVSAGLWAINGVAINATAAAGNIYAALGTAALEFAGVASIISTIKIAKEKIFNIYKKHKNKKESSKESDIKNDIPEENEEIKKEDQVEKRDLVDAVNIKIGQYIKAVKNIAPQYQIQMQQNIADLKRINEIIINGKNTSITNTIDFAGYRIDSKDKAELEMLLKKHNIDYIKEKNNVSEKIEQLKEERNSLISKEDSVENERSI